MSQPTLLASIIAGEASGNLAQQAVLNVIQNRAADNFGGHGTTWIQQATAPLQFSAYPNALGKPTADTYAMIAAAIDGQLGNIVPKAMNYANPKLTSVEWVKEANATGLGVDIGGNVFWADDKGGSPGYDPTKAWVASPTVPAATVLAVPAATMDQATALTMVTDAMAVLKLLLTLLPQFTVPGAAAVPVAIDIASLANSLAPLVAAEIAKLNPTGSKS